MDLTNLAATLLEPIPANRLFGLEVVRAADASAEVGLRVKPEMTNVIGSLHSSGLVALVDATGLATIIAAASGEDQFKGITPLGTLAKLEFLAPARGQLRGYCVLENDQLATLERLLERAVAKARLETAVEVVDSAAKLVCRGSFTWKLRRAET